MVGSAAVAAVSVVEQSARAGSFAGQLVGRVDERTHVERQAATADAPAEPFAEPLQQGDLVIEPRPPRICDSLPVRSVRRSSIGKLGHVGADLAESETDLLGHADERHPADHVAPVPSLATRCPLSMDQATVLVEPQCRRGNARAPAQLADRQGRSTGHRREYRSARHDEVVDDGARIARAIEIADALLRAAEATTTRSERRRQERLGRLIADPAGRDLVQRLTDEVLRLERPRAAAHRFAALAGHGIPRSLGRGDRLLMAAGALAAKLAPPIVMPLVRRRIIAETRGLVVPSDDATLTRHIAERTRAGVQLNLNLLGEAILSDEEAEQRIGRVITTLQRPDVDYLSVKISAVCALLDVVAFEHSVERIQQALRRIYDAAITASPPVFVNLDMEEYGDLALTVESFLGVLDESPYRRMPAGIVLQAYLPDSHDVMERIGTWAAQRVAGGGAPIKVRVVKGANLAMEQVDAEQHGWVQAPYPTKADTDASFKRLLDSCLRPEWAGAIRLGVASHNLLRRRLGADPARGATGTRRADIDIEMLEGMVPAQARAVRERAGQLLLYCPIVRDDEIEASLAYLARRFDENTAPENFLRAMFTMRPGSAEFDAQAERFRLAVAGSSLRDDRSAAPAAHRRGGTGVRQPSRHRLHRCAAPSRHRRGHRQARRERLPRWGVPVDHRRGVDRRGRRQGGGRRAGVVRPLGGGTGSTARRGRHAAGRRTVGDVGPDGGGSGQDRSRGRPGGLRGGRLRPLLRHRGDPATTVAVRRGRRGVALELPVRDPRRRRAGSRDGRQHGDPQTAPGDPPDGVAPRQPVLACRDPT